MTPTLSVVVPTRNRSDLLIRCLQHLQQQTCASMEVWVVDDGSDAAHQTALAAFWPQLDARFKRLEASAPGSARPSGPSVVRNLGWQTATGSVVAFCDDDDLWTDPNHAHHVVDAFAAEPQLDLYMANQRTVHVDGRTSDNWLPGLTQQLPGGLSAPPQAVTLEQLCRMGGFGHMNMVALRRSLLERLNGGFWPRVGYEEDRDLFWRAADQARLVVFNPQVVCQHHVPDPAKRVNASTQFDTTERWLVALLVSQHIVAHARHPGLVKLCTHHQGDLLRRLAGAAKADQRVAAACRYAWQALVCRFSWKWLGVCLAYSLLALKN